MTAPSITTRILLAAVLPAVLVVLMLSAYLTVQRVNEIRDVEMERTAALLEGLAHAAEFGVATGNAALLESVGRSALGSDAVQEVRFTDAGGDPLATVSRARSAMPSDGLPGTRWWWHEAETGRRLSRPVTLTDMSAFDDPLLDEGSIDASAGGRRIGTVSLEFDLSRAFAQQRRAVRRGLGIASLVLLLVLPAAWRLARSVTNDLHAALGALEARHVELSAARAQAERANLAKSQFLASMSHEIRTPMHAIVGTLSTLRHSALDADQRAQLDLVERSSTTLLTMLDDVLDLSRIEAGHLQLDSNPFDLGELLREIEWTHAGAARSRGLHLVIAPPPEGSGTMVTGDALRLKQVLFNLLGNAIKFTDEGGVRLELDRHDPAPDTDAEPRWHFSVVDTGRGIPRDRLASVCDPFEQADMSMTRRFGGAGLGLHICRELVERMGGTIDLHSIEGEGTRVDVRLPLPTAISPSPAARNAAERPASGDRRRPRSHDVSGAVRTESPRVLAVDDQPINLGLLGRYFDHLDVRATLVRSADEAYPALEGGRFDLLLLDLHMPESDGFEIAAAVREGEAPGARLPILALTADAFGSTRERALAAGFDDVLVKPVTMEHIGAVLERWTGRRERRATGGVSLARTAGAVADDVGWARTALDTFEQEVPGHVTALERALDDEDRDALFRTAHAIRGVSAVLRIDTAFEEAGRLSSSAGSADWQAVRGDTERLIVALTDARTACRAALASA